jgi:hypothetical protein
MISLPIPPFVVTCHDFLCVGTTRPTHTTLLGQIIAGVFASLSSLSIHLLPDRECDETEFHTPIFHVPRLDSVLQNGEEEGVHRVMPRDRCDKASKPRMCSGIRTHQREWSLGENVTSDSIQVKNASKFEPPNSTGCFC